MERLFLFVMKDIGQEKKFHLEFEGLVWFLCFVENAETFANFHAGKSDTQLSLKNKKKASNTALL